MATRDWQAIKTEYVTGEISLRALAERHGAAASTLRERAVADGWEEARSQFRAKTAQKTLEYAESAEIDVRREILDSFLEARREWASSKRKADDYGALARLAASVVGLDTEHGTQNVNVTDWRAGKTADEIAAVEEAARIVNER